MFKPIGVVLSFMFLSLVLRGQILPADNALLNHRIVGFSVPENSNAGSYVFQIAKGNISNEQLFVKAIVTKHKTTTSKDIIEVPNWGNHYTWRAVFYNKAGQEIGSTPMHHFETGMPSYVDSTKNGLTVFTHPKDHGDVLVLVDRTLNIYDLKGKPVWYMPDIPELKRRDVNIRDFKATADGTFTFMIQEDAVEVDYYGRIVWKAPNDGKVSGRSSEGYHHEFTKLSNGHYMVAGSEIIKRLIPGNKDDYFAETDKSISKGSDGRYYKEFTVSTLIEYDAAGNVLWTWRTAEHLTDDDFFWDKTELVQPFDSNPYMNGFEFDETNKVIYISYKNINRILKISYPDGEVLNNYGDKGGKSNHFSHFYGQHSCRLNRRTNELYVYNNNHSDYIQPSNWLVDEGGFITSHVVKYKMPPGRNDNLIKNWDVSLRLSEDKSAQQVSIRCGSVSILEDDCVLVNMGTLNMLMIVDKQKKRIWEAIPYTTEEGRKAPLLPYRSSFMYKKDIEKFVFKTDTLAKK